MTSGVLKNIQWCYSKVPVVFLAFWLTCNACKHVVAHDWYFQISRHSVISYMQQTRVKARLYQHLKQQNLLTQVK